MTVAAILQPPRPRYFDGRFLAARDLERDQGYFTARLAEHLRAAGTGVIHGLAVTSPDPAVLAIASGAAVTASGQLVVLREPLALSVTDGATTERLDRELGLLRTPRDLARRGSGLFVLLARPVEYTANPIGIYPASIEQRRAPEDGEIIEAIALTLVPFRDPALDVEPARQRAVLGRRLFVERADPGVPVEAVPLAIVQLERGFVRWVDMWSVRRELGQASALRELGGSRARFEAFIQHHHHHLGDVIAARAAAHLPDVFAAADELAALPAAGRYPHAALDLAARVDRFFPAAMPIVFQIVPDDELSAILDEALLLPPINLGLPAANLSAIPIAIIAGVPRADAEALPPSARKFALRAAATPAPPGPVPLPPAIDLGAAALYFARRRRALGDTEEGVMTIEFQGGEA